MFNTVRIPIIMLVASLTTSLRDNQVHQQTTKDCKLDGEM